VVPRGSDSDKLLGEARTIGGRRARKLLFRFEHPDGYRFETPYLEDSSHFE
jgi:hypothetical protein